MNRIEDATFCVFDLETASIVEGGVARICEVGAIKTTDGREEGRFSSLVNPEAPISEDATKIHGISEAMVKDAPRFTEVAPKLAEFTRGTILVAHNTAFDIPVLNHELRRIGQPVWRGASVDTIRLARKAYKGLPSYSLDTLADFFEVGFTQRHRSIGDCEVTVHVFWKCVARLREIEMAKTLLELLEVGRNRRAEQPV